MTTALLIIDIQNDYFAGGNMALDNPETAAANASRLLADFRARHLPVVHIQHLMQRPGAGYLVPGTPGADIHPSVAPLPGETVLTKHFPNSFRGTGLADRLEALGVGHLVITGMMTHMCVDTTTRAAFDLGYKITLAYDACATRTLKFGDVTVPAAQVQASYVAALNGVFGEARSVEDLLRRESAVV
jgi:nicotinamidase-related amidase